MQSETQRGQLCTTRPTNTCRQIWAVGMHTGAINTYRVVRIIRVASVAGIVRVASVARIVRVASVVH